MNGRVCLVGAGPGDPGLLTVRGRELLERADVVIHDRLIGAQLLELVRDGCDVVDAGKNAGDHTLTQDEINELLVRHARAGRMVVRLKGGDPYVFGRGGEEAAYCRVRGVDVEVVPGVTSAFAAAAAGGVPVTHRGVSQHVTVVTASAGEDGAGDPDYEWLARSTGTVVLLMGLRRTRHVAEQLIAAGAPTDRPVAVISRGTHNNQRTITGTLATIADRVEEAQPASPAIIVVGDVVNLRDQLDWFEQRPLFGVTVTVTRARAQASDLVRQLTELGATVIESPMIRVEPLDPKPLREALVDMTRWKYVLLTSTNGAEIFFEQLRAGRKDSRALTGVRFGVVGQVTANVCRENGIEPDIIPVKGTSIALLERMQTEPIYGEQVLVVRGQEGEERLPEGLGTAGAKVTLIPVYRTVIDVPDVATIKAALTSDVVTFTSASTVANFAKLVPEGITPPKAVSIGPVTTRAAKEHGFDVVAESIEPSVTGIRIAVLEYIQQVAADSAQAHAVGKS